MKTLTTDEMISIIKTVAEEYKPCTDVYSDYYDSVENKASEKIYEAFNSLASKLAELS
jgi:hypothetical protein